MASALESRFKTRRFPMRGRAMDISSRPAWNVERAVGEVSGRHSEEAVWSKIRKVSAA